jgi:hypothetical protein
VAGARPTSWDLEGTPTDGAAEAEQAHESLDRAARHHDVFPVQLAPHFARTVHLKVLVPHALNFGPQLAIALYRAGAHMGSIARLRCS